MSKKLKNMKWESVALDGVPMSMSDKFDGFVGLEECTIYSLDKESKKSSRKKQQSKRKILESAQKEVPVKKPRPNKSKPAKKQKEIKFSNGFIVESCESTVPSQTNEKCIKAVDLHKQNHDKPNKEKKKNKHKKSVDSIHSQSNKTVENAKKAKQPKLGEENTQTSDLTPEDMLTWAEFKLQEPIVRALMELGFKQPTKIQQLSLPAAIHGRRDILGAAETGSGKTLAFGLPILSGILKLKEKAEAKGLDVYEIPYKKGPARKKEAQVKPMNKKGNKNRNTKKKAEVKPKESSEDGYSSGDDESSSSDKVIEPKKIIKKKYKKAEDYLEEYEVPVKKSDISNDDENDSDDENYIHLSDMLDSEDLADSNDEQNDNVDEDDNESDENGDRDENESDENGDRDENESDENGDIDENESDENNDDSENDDEIDDVVSSSGDDDVESGVEEESDGMDEVESDEEVEDLGNPHETGIGCVKVMDNIEIPGHTVTKTGKPMYALILTPTRELAIQISRHLMAAAKYTGIRIATIVGGMAAVKQERLLRSGPEVVVATPGRLWELINQGQPHLQQLDTVKFLAIDETDRMIERGHFEELTPLLERLNADEARSAARQNFVFSATLTLVHDLPTHMKGKKVTKHGKILNRKVQKMTPEQKVKRLVDLLGMTEPKIVDITQQNLGTADSLTSCRITCPMEHKDAYLVYMLKRHPGRTMVFCNSIGSVKRLANLLTILKFHPLPLHASMPQRQRLKNLERFRDCEHGVLIATDVAARGLDVPRVQCVVQYQVPRTAEGYVHRGGRTARAHAPGLNLLLVAPDDAYLYSKLCLTLNISSEVPTFPVAPHQLAPLKELVRVGREVLALEQLKRRSALARGWKEKAAREMDIIIDDEDIPTQAADPSLDRALKAKRRLLDLMVSRPVFPAGFSFKYPTLNEPNALTVPQDNAIQVMKNAIESGELKKEKRRGKNAPLLKLYKGIHNDGKLKNK